MRRNIGLFLWTVLWIPYYKTALIYINVSVCTEVDNTKKTIFIKCITNKIEIS